MDVGRYFAPNELTFAFDANQNGKIEHQNEVLNDAGRALLFQNRRTVSEKVTGQQPESLSGNRLADVYMLLQYPEGPKWAPATNVPTGLGTFSTVTLQSDGGAWLTAITNLTENG